MMMYRYEDTLAGREQADQQKDPYPSAVRAYMKDCHDDTFLRAG